MLVVENAESPVSCSVASYYMHKRGVRNLAIIHCADAAATAVNETTTYAVYQKQIEAPIGQFLATHPKIDFIVLTKGIPIRIEDAPGRGLGGRRPSLDSLLAALDYESTPGAVLVSVHDSGFTGAGWENRFWNSPVGFSHRKFGGYLVTRLDGYSEADAKALVDRSIEADHSRPTGTILLDTCPTFGYSSPAGAPLPLLKSAPVDPKTKPDVGELEFKDFNADMERAADLLKQSKIPVELDKTDTFVGDRTGLMGYTSWGSNDRHFDANAYHSLGFAPGAIGDTAVSTSGRTFFHVLWGQSMVADLISQGITGVKGYTDEPLLQAIASPSILFDRYTRGWTLAESFYAASRFLGWEDLVIGDPICRAYGTGGAKD